MTGVIAVAMIVPACQNRETTVAAATAATAAAISVVTWRPPLLGGEGAGSG
jgi:hypothetical protein